MKDRRNPLILNVDDNDPGRYVTTRILRQAGFEVIEAATGREALRLAEEGPDLILLDVKLPDISGFEVCRQIRNNQRTAGIPVVHLSATCVGSDDQALGIEQGADGYLIQPVDPKVLVATINAFLRLKVAEQTLRESELRYRRLFEAAKDGILILDAQTGKVVDVNPYLLDLLGYSYDDLCGQYVWDLGVFKDIAASKDAFKILQENKYIHYDDLPLESRNGRPIAVEFISNLYVVDETNVIQCNIRDITERKRTEEQLRLSEQTYKGILDSITEAVYIEDAHGRIIYVNRTAEEMFGYATEEFIGRTAEFLFAQGKNDLSKIGSYREKVIHGEPQSFEYWGLHKNGTLIHVEGTLSLGQYFGKNVLIAVSRDISERKAIEQLLRDVQRRESIGILSSGIAHDFNNLLAVMMGNVSLVHVHLPPGHQALKNLEQALSAMESAAELTQQILAYSGKGKYQVHTIDLGAELQKHVSLFNVSMPKNIRLVTELPPAPVYVNGDPGQIKQIIMNLILNGSDAIGDKQGVETITLTAVTLNDDELTGFGKYTNTTLRAGSYALLEVSDNGIGMSREILGKIFDPFFSTKFIGRGLGLSAVLGIIRGHEGGIAIESAEGSGSTFRIVLPACAAPGTQTQPRADASPSAPMTTTVLVIDDEPDVAAMAQDILELGKYTVLVELNPLRGIERYRQHRSEIGVVLLDLTMPEMSGKDVLDALRSINPDVKIIISSGYSESEMYKKIGAAKASGYLQKPYPMQALLTMVQRMMEGT